MKIVNIFPICLSTCFSPAMTTNAANPDKLESILMPLKKYLKTKLDKIKFMQKCNEEVNI